jgi:hypothetical protein
MRLAAVLSLLLLSSACAGAYHTSSDGRLQTRIDTSYEARDQCLARHSAANDISHSDTRTIAQAVALACAAETERLIEVSNRDGDPKVSAAIRKDSEFRAMGYVLRARGQVGG